MHFYTCEAVFKKINSRFVSLAVIYSSLSLVHNNYKPVVCSEEGIQALFDVEGGGGGGEI